MSPLLSVSKPIFSGMFFFSKISKIICYSLSVMPFLWVAQRATERWESTAADLPRELQLNSVERAQGNSLAPVGNVVEVGEHLLLLPRQDPGLPGRGKNRHF